MIEIEITNVNDPQRLGPYKFYLNEITVGSGAKSQVYIPDQDLEEKHLSLKITETKIFMEQPEGFYCHVNKMRTAGKKQLKVNDLIKYGDLEFKLINFLEERYISRKEKLNERIEEIEKNERDLVPLLQKLSELDEKHI